MDGAEPSERTTRETAVKPTEQITTQPGPNNSMKQTTMTQASNQSGRYSRQTKQPNKKPNSAAKQKIVTKAANNCCVQPISRRDKTKWPADQPVAIKRPKTCAKLKWLVNHDQTATKQKPNQPNEPTNCDQVKWSNKRAQPNQNTNQLQLSRDQPTKQPQSSQMTNEPSGQSTTNAEEPPKKIACLEMWSTLGVKILVVAVSTNLIG